MLNNYMLDKVLDKIKETRGIKLAISLIEVIN